MSFNARLQTPLHHLHHVLHRHCVLWPCQPTRCEIATTAALNQYISVWPRLDVCQFRQHHHLVHVIVDEPMGVDGEDQSVPVGVSEGYVPLPSQPLDVTTPRECIRIKQVGILGILGGALRGIRCDSAIRIHGCALVGQLAERGQVLDHASGSTRILRRGRSGGCPALGEARAADQNGVLLDCELDIAQL
eukprot:CAMPEP_0181225398 /NCGR_PEP_ID=MMETSP1096-20121128/31667_1 /TAXON_ID=156174 ORGANISM="Chrysochromulina ericina, Strain CCMP281" /NCGR_SAMPLE_ID=MMETSP1096 /ASSEMBLY_ACC=CAM_ASM_000453 /LENGTH=189 /DNA_ID=CAMNT_0023318601 /DNA_START=591 /DNA_END=1160 /DNA_ORIENTATION=+